jgi:hypothetical protein
MDFLSLTASGAHPKHTRGFFSGDRAVEAHNSHNRS